jgi:hypothetical protein
MLFQNDCISVGWRKGGKRADDGPAQTEVTAMAGIKRKEWTPHQLLNRTLSSRKRAIGSSARAVLHVMHCGLIAGFSFFLVHVRVGQLLSLYQYSLSTSIARSVGALFMRSVAMYTISLQVLVDGLHHDHRLLFVGGLILASLWAFAMVVAHAHYDVKDFLVFGR